MSKRSRPRRPDEVYDKEGRQRFHGAFTGGFSAGYYNTVGSRDGWVPKPGFQSVRGDQNKNRITQSIQDFMDDEDEHDTKISSTYSRQYGNSFGRNDRIAELMVVDDRIGLKLMRKACARGASGRKLSDFEEHDFVIPTASSQIEIPPHNINCRGLGFVVDNILHQAKEASLQNFYKPDEEYDVYDTRTREEISNEYVQEINDYNDDKDDNSLDHEDSHQSLLSNFHSYIDMGKEFIRNNVLPGFRLGSEEASLLQRFPGPDVPIEFEIIGSRFPIKLTENEIGLERPTHANKARNIAAKNKNTNMRSLASTNLSKVVSEMQNRFTPASGQSEDVIIKVKAQFEPKREVFTFFPNRLLSKRFGFPPISGVLPESKKERQSKDEMTEFDRTIFDAAEERKALERDEDITPKIKRPPLDIFKSIFAAGSDNSSSSEDEAEISDVLKARNPSECKKAPAFSSSSSTTNNDNGFNMKERGQTNILHNTDDSSSSSNEEKRRARRLSHGERIRKRKSASKSNKSRKHSKHKDSKRRSKKYKKKRKYSH